MDRNRPIQTFRLGRIQAAIWANPGPNGTWYNVTVKRSYKDAKDAWQDTGHFTLSDLPLVSKVVEHAYAYLYTLQPLPAGTGEYDDVRGLGEAPCGAVDELSAA